MIKNPFNVLVFPGGTEIGLEIQRALCQCKEVRLRSAGQDVSNHAPYVFARHFLVPSVTEPNWLGCLSRLLDELRIDYVFPAHDDVIVALSENADKISARTSLFTFGDLPHHPLKSTNLSTPTGNSAGTDLYPDLRAVPRYPVFVKPDKGQGSQHTHIVQDETAFTCSSPSAVTILLPSIYRVRSSLSTAFPTVRSDSSIARVGVVFALAMGYP